MLGWENLFHCEINPFGRKVLDYWYPQSKSYEDITRTDFTEWRGRVDVLTGGFPCQPFSYAGRRRGAEDDRYLWPSMYRAIDEIQPTWVVAENVAGILTMVEQGEVSKVAGSATLFDAFDDLRGRYELRETFTLQRICTDLESHGYAVQPVLVPACAVGAPHRRDRVFIVARRVTADTCSGGQSAPEQQGERERTEVQQQSGEQSQHGTGRPSASHAPADPACGREGTPRPSEEPESSRGDTHQQPSERGAASEWNNRLHAVLRHAADTADEGLQRRHDCDTQGHGQSSDGCTRQPCESMGRERTSADPSDARLQHGHQSGGESGEVGTIQGQGSDTFWNVYAQADGYRRETTEAGRNECAGNGRWEHFPSVSPVHRGNDGLPFDVDRLTLSFGKWRTEALKAYGNAIVPQVMYEIFRAIEIVEQDDVTKQKRGYRKSYLNR